MLNDAGSTSWQRLRLRERHALSRAALRRAGAWLNRAQFLMKVEKRRLCDWLTKCKSPRCKPTPAIAKNASETRPHCASSSSSASSSIEQVRSEFEAQPPHPMLRSRRQRRRAHPHTHTHTERARAAPALANKMELSRERTCFASLRLALLRLALSRARTLAAVRNVGVSSAARVSCDRMQTGSERILRSGWL